mgnify:FL=1
MKTDKILIVGGGSAGWMTAATLISKFPNKDITLVEHPEIKSIGVGESTLGQIRQWFNYIGLHESEFLKETDGIVKLSIKFTDFYKKGESFHYPFGSPVIDGNLYQTNDWWFKKIVDPSTPNSNFAETMYPVMSMINQNKFALKSQVDLGFDYQGASAVHFDAIKFANWLRDKFCIPKGVKHKLIKIKDIQGNQDEGIKHVDGLTADLYIDCTGYHAALIGSFNHGWYSYRDILPNNKAIATQIPYKNKEKEIVPYTECTAVENGWVWNIPLWSRRGCGFVYSDDFITKHEADAWFRDYLKDDSLKFKHIEFPVGIQSKLWAKNCVAIGMSAGFIEPLESSGLFTVHEFLIKLCRELESDYITDINRSNFNYSCHLQFREFAEFVSSHYALSKRDDSKYWRFLTQNKDYNTIGLEDPTIYPFYGLKKYLHDRNRNNIYPYNEGISCIAAGMNFAPVDRHTVQYENNTPTMDTYFQAWTPHINNLNERKKHWDQIASKYPSYYNWLKNRFYEDS